MWLVKCNNRLAALVSFRGRVVVVIVVVFVVAVVVVGVVDDDNDG